MTNESIEQEARDEFFRPIRAARKQADNELLAEYRKHSRLCVEDAVRDFGRAVVENWVLDAPETDWDDN